MTVLDLALTLTSAECGTYAQQQGCGVGVGIGRSRLFWPESESTKFCRLRLRLCSRKISFHRAQRRQNDLTRRLTVMGEQSRPTIQTNIFPSPEVHDYACNCTGSVNRNGIGSYSWPNKCFPELIGWSRSRRRSGVGVDLHLRSSHLSPRPREPQNLNFGLT